MPPTLNLSTGGTRYVEALAATKLSPKQDTNSRPGAPPATEAAVSSRSRATPFLTRHPPSSEQRPLPFASTLSVLQGFFKGFKHASKPSSTDRFTVSGPSVPPALGSRQIEKKFRELEYQQRGRIIQGFQDGEESSPWARLTGDEVLERNRYLNIDPWANNRIHLQVPAGQNDYINASPISMKRSRNGIFKKYIATQGPKESSSEHFWQMIWHETGSPAVIVMLTQTHEAGKEKCSTYFPLNADSGDLEINSHLNDGNESNGDVFRARLELLESRYDNKTRSTVRKLSLKVGKEEKTVWHYLFVGWPDFYIPEGEDRVALLELLQESALIAGDSENRRVVHCSAGVGRSGTFIALDFLLDELRDGAMDELSADQDRIAETVNELRKQRMMMVQGESQFDFLYEIMKEQWLEHHGLAPPAEVAKEEVAKTVDTSTGTKDDEPT